MDMAARWGTAMSRREWDVPRPCPRCTGYGDAHYLSCPLLRPAPFGWGPWWLAETRDDAQAEEVPR
jgi:hypothetical protein